MSELQRVINDLLARIEALEDKVPPVQEFDNQSPNSSVMDSNGSYVQSSPTQTLESG